MRINFHKLIRPYKAAVMIDIDDVHPENSKNGYDSSGDMDNGVFNYLNRLVKEFSIKITLFVTPNWNYKPFKYFLYFARTWNDRFRIDEHPEWCNWLREKIKTGNFDVGIHGYSHYQLMYPFQCEFKNLDKEKSFERLRKSEELFEKSKIPFVKIFRPPGWFISNEALDTLSAQKYILAASADAITPPSPVSICRITGLRGSLIYPHFINNVINITANCDIKRTRLERIERIIKYNGLVVLHGHIEEEYRGIKNRNGVDEKSYDNLRKIFGFLKNRYGRKITYLGARDLYNLLKQLNNSQAEKNEI